MNNKLMLLVALIVISAVLLVIALKLWRKLQAREQSELQLQQQKDQQRDEHLEKSLGLIAQTTLRDDLPLAEAAIRAKLLLDHLIPDEDARQKYQAIYALHDATEHFARSDDRQALSLQARTEQDIQRQKLEALHREGVLACMRSILEQGFR